MAENYFDPDEKPVVQDTQSSDNSKSGVRAAWDAWTSRPENNAALLQFGIAMMQPRSQSQTGIGHFANALGEAGEASTRNVAQQNLELDKEAQREERLSTAEYRGKQGDAALINANAYSKIASQGGIGGAGAGGGLARTQLSAQLRTQQAFRQWLQKPEDTTGLSVDPLVGAISRQYPQVKTKADLVNNPQALKAAFQLYAQQFSTEPPDSPAVDPSMTAPPASAQPAQPGVAAPPAAPAPMTKTFYDAKTGVGVPHQWDGTKWIPIR